MKMPPLTRGRLLRRYKRFLADIEVEGQTLTAHCANPGSMKTLAVEGAPVWISESDNPKRKLRHTWELIEIDGAMISVNTQRGNQLVEEALSNRRIEELGYESWRREVRVGDKSRIDFVLEADGEKCYLEVKTVTMWAAPGVASFPDSVTTRGARHLEELMALKKAGHRSVLLFCVARDDAELVKPADDIDPAYGKALRKAADCGVEILAYRAAVSDKQIELTHAVPVDLR